jgi:hypothetical protein
MTFYREIATIGLARIQMIIFWAMEGMMFSTVDWELII